MLKSVGLPILLALLGVIAATALLLTHQPIIAVYLALVISIASLMLALKHIRITRRSVDALDKVLANFTQGQLNARVLTIPSQDAWGKCLHRLNNMLDAIDLLARKEDAAFDVSQPEYVEKLKNSGLYLQISALLPVPVEPSKAFPGSTEADELQKAMGSIALLQGHLNAMQRAITILQSPQGESSGTQGKEAAARAQHNVESVAAASEELSYSIKEIAARVQESSKIAEKAVSHARNSNYVINSLDIASTKIGDVVNLINDIAGQTNLLALNATIEAARAGEAGRGFAVVASEVKSLADQTAQATDEITMQISSIQEATKHTVEAIQQIGQIIDKISEISTAIASAVEEQSAATNEITRNIHLASEETQKVSAHVEQSTKPLDMGELVQQLDNAMEKVATLQTELQKLQEAQVA